MKTKLPLPNVNSESYTPRILAMSLLAVLLLLALTGCKNKSGAYADNNPAGVYTLVRVDDRSVPCQVTHEGMAMNIKSGVFTFDADGGCRSLINLSVPPRPDLSREVKATYSCQGTEITMRWEGAGVTKGQINGNQFTMTNEGMVFSYRKQSHDSGPPGAAK